MKKRFSTIMSIAIIICFLALAVASSGTDEPTKETGANGGASETGNTENSNYSLNDTASFKNIKVTANKIEKSNGSQYLEPGDDNTFVGVHFTIENTSDKEQTISSILLFEAYVDDVKADHSFSGLMAFSNDGSLDGQLSPGKKMEGWYAVEAPENASKLELEVKSSWLGSGKAVFEFDMPK